MITLLTENKAVEISAAVSNNPEELWVSADEAQAATGWQLKPEGYCKDDVCVPLPSAAGEEFHREGQVNLSALWSLMGKPIAVSEDRATWSLGESAQTRNDELLSLEAPNFTLPDFSGKLHSLTDFRRKRVLLITWASW